MAQNKLFVGNLGYTVDEAQLRTLFSRYGDVTHIAMIKDRDSGQPRGFAFVTFAAQRAAEQALEQNGRELGGRPLKVSVAIERDAHEGGRPNAGRPGGNRRLRRP